ncbi:MAG: hypothetical protein ABIP30_07670 [Ferruginibacter sp.]
MNVIFCSAKLAKLLNIKTKVEVASLETATNMGHWNAHLFYHQRKKYIIFMNKLSIYSVTINDYRKTDLLTLKVLFIKALEAQCEWDKIVLSKETLRQHFSEIIFSTTDNDRSAIGSLNDLIYHAKASLDGERPSFYLTDQNEILFNMNKMPMWPINGEYPNKRFVTLFEGV